MLRRLLVHTVLALCLAAAAALPAALAQDRAFSRQSPAKAVLLFSYHEGFWVTRDENQGVVQGLARAGYVEGENLELVRLYMNTKTENKTSEAMEASAADMLARIREMGPDLVFMMDDDALQHAGAKLLDTGIPVVFAGINFQVTDPDYGWLDAQTRTPLADSRELPGHNLTGVLERISFPAGISLLRQILPRAETALFISDNSMTGKLFIENAGGREELEQSGLNFVDFVFTDSFEELQRVILDYQDKVDCILLFLPWTLEDRAGRSVDQRDVVRWMLMHNERPGVGFLDILPEEGYLCGMVVDMAQQGEQAGIMAGRILDGEDPAVMPIVDPIANRVMLNLARAEQLGVDIPFDVLKAADKVFDTMSAWPEYPSQAP